jgi:FkbM family methyltransferase
MKTIFDLGMHEGCDTEFYLKKGFRVVAVEANPQFLPAVRERLASYLTSGQLQIVNRVLAERDGGSVPFYVRADKGGWSSIHRAAAERDGISSTRIDVASTTLAGLVAQFGVPYFIKCDLEGADELVAKQLGTAAEKPCFASFEASPQDDRLIDLLVAAGFGRFQVVNQGYLELWRPPRPAREGAYVEQRFHGKDVRPVRRGASCEPLDGRAGGQGAPASLAAAGVRPGRSGARPYAPKIWAAYPQDLVDRPRLAGYPRGPLTV